MKDNRAPGDFFSEVLAEARDQSLLRTLRKVESVEGPVLRVDGKSLIGFASNDYLGLARHPSLREASIEALKQYGAGSGASRLVSGTLAPHLALEEELAGFKGTEASLAFSCGYSAAVGTIQALAGDGDIVILDKLSHASLIDGARLSGATLRVFPHNNLDRLEDLLKWSAEKRNGGKVLVVTESIFSMDGDACPLAEIVELKDRYGAWLLLDEAHGVGVLGKCGEGLAGLAGVSHRVDFQMGTLGKALGSAGGYLCGSRPFVDFLINRARSFIFSTAPPPAQAAAARTALQIVSGKEGGELRGKLHSNRTLLRKMVPMLPDAPAAILPFILGPEDKALTLSRQLLENGLLVPAIRYPTVAKWAARLRISLSAAHTTEHLGWLAQALQSCAPERPAAP